MKKGCIEEIVENYLREKLIEEIKDEFINATIHFNINENVYDTYGNLRVECMLSKIKSEEVMNYIELSSIYGYIIFRSIQNNLLDKEDVIEGLQVVLTIKNTLTRYIIKTIDEEELFDRLKSIINKIGLNDEYNDKIISML